MSKMLAKAALAAAVLAAPGTVAAQAEADVATGCLTLSGQIIKVAIGDQPTRACGPRQTQVTLRLGVDDEEEGGHERVDFFLAIERDGPDETIATNGPFEIFARCYTDPFGGLNFFIRLVGEVDGWWGSAGAAHGPYVAGEELQMFAHSISSTSEERGFYNGSKVGAEALSAVAPDGSYIGIEPDTLGLGMKILGHDCIAIGTAILLRSTVR